VLRGSSWRNFGVGTLRSAFRHEDLPIARWNWYGFRCVLTNGK
jgi:formylglycine-generating enzyme required for sulfatase activity